MINIASDGSVNGTKIVVQGVDVSRAVKALTWQQTAGKTPEVIITLAGHRINAGLMGSLSQITNISKPTAVAGGLKVWIVQYVWVLGSLLSLLLEPKSQCVTLGEQ